VSVQPNGVTTGAAGAGADGGAEGATFVAIDAPFDGGAGRSAGTTSFPPQPHFALRPAISGFQR